MLVSPSTPVTLPAGTATLVNTAVIDSGTPGTDTNPAPVDVPVQAKADLTLVKTPSAASVPAGTTFTWNLAVGNSGPSDAAGPITVVDTLPDHESFLSTGSAGWACSGTTTVTCVLADGVAAGAHAPALALLVQVDATAPAGTETNNATASSPTPGAAGAGTADVTVTRTAMLSLTKTHTGPVAVGGDLPFTLQVHNAGPSVADQVVVSDPLPAGLTYVSGASTGWTCSASGDSCVLDGTLAVGADAPVLTVTAKVGAAAYPQVTNVATVRSTDPALPGVATARDTVTVPPSAQLALTKKHVGAFVVGHVGTYQLTVRNVGLTANPGPILIADPLPSGLTYRSVSAAGWVCEAKGQLVGCGHAGALAAGKSLSLRLIVEVGAAAYPSVINTAAATGPGSQPATGTDMAPVTPTVVLGLTKKLLSYSDDLATYRITVTDKGPNATVGPLTVTDPLPTGLTYRSATGPGWSCAASGGTVRCLRAASLAVGASSSITLVALVSALPGTTISNVATVSGGGMASGGVTVLPSNSAILGVTATGNGAAGGGGGALAQTGRNNRDPLVFAGLMLLVGAGLILLGRRRRIEM